MQTPPSWSRILVYVVPAAGAPLGTAFTALAATGFNLWTLLASIMFSLVAGTAAYKALVFPGE